MNKIFCRPFVGFTHAKISNPFKRGSHEALDIYSRSGEPLLALEDGEVIHIQTPGRLLDFNDYSALARGYGIRIKGKSGYTHVHWHTQGVFPVNVGDQVKQGQVVAFMGNSGFVKSWNGIEYVVVPVEIRMNKPYKGVHDHLIVSEQTTSGEHRIDWIDMIDWNIKVQNPRGLLKAIKVTLNKIMRLFGL